jgi:hypothetical protein
LLCRVPSFRYAVLFKGCEVVEDGFFHWVAHVSKSFRSC